MKFIFYMPKKIEMFTNKLKKSFLSILAAIFVLKIAFFLSYQIVLGQIAVLAHSTGVMGSLFVLTRVSHFSFAFAMITIMAHILCVMLLICMRAFVYRFSFSFDVQSALLLLIFIFIFM